jgi:predicted nucleic-acid-binding Zn-ribbon protein
MKKGACPKCQGRDMYEIEEALLPDRDSANMSYPLTLTAHYGPTGKMGFFGDKMDRAEVRVTACVCATCAYTELYAKELASLAMFAEQGVGGVRKVKR